MTARTLPEHVAARAHLTPARPALREDGRTVTYAELDWASRRLGERLRESGVRPGDRVAVHGDPGVATVVALLAVLGARAVWTGLNPRYSLREIDDVVGAAAPSLLLSAGPVRPGLDDLAAEAGARLLRLDEDGQVERATAGSRTDVPEVGVPPGTGALVFTSGSTGAPKGALIGSAELAGCCEVAARRWAADLDVVLCDLPVNHVGFVGDIVGTALVAGATVVLAPRFDPGQTLRLIGEERVTAWTGVPAMFAAALADPALAAADLTSVRRVLWGGAAMPAGLLPALAAVTPAPLTSVYGTTETVGNVADLDSTGVTHLTDLAGSLGRPVPPYRIRVVDDTGAEVADGDDGLVEVLTPHGFSGYLGRPEATAAVRAPDGWLRTGDLARRGPDGSLTYLGRADGLFKTGGYFVNPAEVEDQIHRLPGVVEAAVVPLPDADRGAVPGALVVASGSPPLEGDDVRADLRRVLAPYKVPRVLRLVPALPRLPLGKVDRAAVAAVLTQEHL